MKTNNNNKPSHYVPDLNVHFYAGDFCWTPVDNPYLYFLKDMTFLLDEETNTNLSRDTVLLMRKYSSR